MLPKIINQPLFELTIPSTKKVISYRQFNVKEEKILLIAQEDGNELTIIKAMIQIVNNCVIDTEFDVRDFASFDLEYLFLKIRAKSVNNMVTVSYRDKEDEKIRDFEIDLDELEIEILEVEKNIKINDTVILTMKYPPAQIVEDAPVFEDNVELMTFFIVNCLDTITDGDDLYLFSEYTFQEKVDYLDTLPGKTFDKMKDFFEKMPKLTKELNYVNDNGVERSIILTGVKDFFM